MILNLNFRWKIFIFYSLFISLLVSGLIFSFYRYVSNTLTRNSFSGMEQSVNRISTQLDSEVSKMDNISTIIFYNKSLQDILIDTISFKSSDINFFDLYPDQKKNVYEILFPIIGINNIPRRVCIFNGKQNYVSLSTFPDNDLISGTDLRNLSWVKDINRQKTNSILISSNKDLWASEKKPVKVISFVRKILYTWGNSSPLGYVEIQQPYSMLDDICSPSLTTNTQIFILDENGTQIYPADMSNKILSNYYYKNTKPSESKSTFLIKNQKNGAEELVYKSVTSKTKWTILQITPKKDLLASVNRIQKMMVLAGILLLIITLIVIYFITNSLTAPIKQLRKSLRKVTLDTPSLDMNFKGSNNEIILLNSVFNKTIQRLHESMNQTIEARSKESEAHLLALQAQMDPHFLYNSLMGISAVGQECNNSKVVEMCTKLSKMLRYTASYNQPNVFFSEEIKHAENYLSMLSFRYEVNLSYFFDIKKEMEEIQVPKLILQPLLENCFSHSFAKIKPPFKILVKGSIQNNIWTITVSDNGLGFKSDDIRKINDQIKAYDENLSNHTYKNKLQVGGMALLNIYVRLKILYNEDAIFKVDNLEPCGAIVTIGGTIKQLIVEDFNV